MPHHCFVASSSLPLLDVIFIATWFGFRAFQVFSLSFALLYTQNTHVTLLLGRSFLFSQLVTPVSLHCHIYMFHIYFCQYFHLLFPACFYCHLSCLHIHFSTTKHRIEALRMTTTTALKLVELFKEFFQEGWRSREEKAGWSTLETRAHGI